MADIESNIVEKIWFSFKNSGLIFNIGEYYYE